MNDWRGFNIFFPTLFFFDLVYLRMYNNDRQEEEKLRMVARLLYTLILTMALAVLITTLIVTAWWFTRHMG